MACGDIKNDKIVKRFNAATHSHSERTNVILIVNTNRSGY